MQPAQETEWSLRGWLNVAASKRVEWSIKVLVLAAGGAHTSFRKVSWVVLKQFGECDLINLIAEITVAEGRVFLRVRHVHHGVFSLFDRAGQARHVVQGVRFARSALAGISRCMGPNPEQRSEAPWGRRE